MIEDVVVRDTNWVLKQVSCWHNDRTNSILLIENDARSIRIHDTMNI
jgi:hypothetical protein